MKACCVDGCEPSDHDQRDITYFQFPIKPALRRKWREAIRLTSKLDQDSLVCSQHFLPDDMEMTRGRIRLKGRVVPSVFSRKLSPARDKSPETNGNSEPDPETGESNSTAKECHGSDSTAKDCHGSGSTAKSDSHEDESMDNVDDYANGCDKNAETDEENSNGGDNSVGNGDKAENDAEVDGIGGDSSVENGIAENMVCDVDVPSFHGVDSEEAENCTVECAPEVLLHPDSDSNSDTELHKEDIEDIIANYHIKQNPVLAKRLTSIDSNNPDDKNTDGGDKNPDGSDKNTDGSDKNPDGSAKIPDSGKDSDSVKSSDNSVKNLNNKDSGVNLTNDLKLDKLNSDKISVINEINSDSDDIISVETISLGKNGKSKKRHRYSKKRRNRKRRKSDDDCMEVEFQPSDGKNDPVFIEVAVESDPVGGTANNDCLMLLEQVQCSIDPCELLAGQDSAPSSPQPEGNEPAISLLTSSDEDDVIIEEPNIDTVEVSDEDEDDLPLMKLVPSLQQDLKLQKDLTKILWGNLQEYYCFICSFKTTKWSEFQKHKTIHKEQVIHMCKICTFSTGSEAQLSKHMKRHKEEKRFKCHLCEYRAKHKMSLVYHFKSHQINIPTGFEPEVTVEPKKKKVKKHKCNKCHREIPPGGNKAHYKECKKVEIFNCSYKKCKYKTKRRSDLTRHINCVHLKGKKESSDDDDDDDLDDDFDPKDCKYNL